jgi:hypothetical protein
MAEWSEIERRTVEMSFIALAGFWQTDPALVAQTVSGIMAKMLPRQEIVWGPAVHQPQPALPGMPPKLSDALVLACRDRGSGELTIVLRGTNTISPTEWLLQDFMIQKQVPWLDLRAGPAPEDALVSEGTARAVTLRLGLRPAPGTPGRGRSLEEFLVSELESSPGPCRMRFTGHSLGGLLAPVMALWLLDRIESGGRRDLADKLELDVYGYAAPTAGNRAFAEYLASRLPAARRYANDIDIAALAWEEAAMKKMPALYEPEIKMQAITKSLIRLCALLCEGKGYAHPGGRILVPAKIESKRGKRFLIEAAYQHCMPYLDILLPERKEAILDEVIRPLTRLMTFEGLKAVDLKKLFKTPDWNLPRQWPWRKAQSPSAE